MQYDYITLDTNVFVENGYQLETGMLGQMSQFKEGSVQFILSEIVVREIKRHLFRGVEKVNDSLNSAIDKGLKNGLIPQEGEKKLDELRAILVSPEDVVMARLEKYVGTTGASIVPAEHAEMKALVALYFGPKAPFEENAKKKNEFPDAIAMLSIENWAKKAEKKVLAISNDRGWQEFGAESGWIDVESDLAAALQKLQEHAEEAEKYVMSFLADLDSGKRPDDWAVFEQDVSDAVSSAGLYGDADGIMRVEVEQIDLTLDEVEIVKYGDEYRFNVVQFGQKLIVVKVPVRIYVEAEGQCSFYVYDSIDKEDLFMGSTSATKKEEFEAFALLRIEGDFSEGLGDVEISSVEVINLPEEIDFDYVELDYEPDDYEEY